MSESMQSHERLGWQSVEDAIPLAAVLSDYTNVFLFCSVSAKLHYSSTLLRDWKEKPKPRESEGIVWQICLTKQYDFASHETIHMLAESLLFPWDVASLQSMELRVSG